MPTDLKYVIPTEKYTTGQLSTLLGVDQKTVRNWTEIGLSRKGGGRIYLRYKWRGGLKEVKGQHYIDFWLERNGENQ